ncbi:MAG: prepilin-type N-terminal cleavage/methylation domain-containing protein [Lachnospiraceae bacterium]|nr:prepilin-type N-terminal cleavage/methylation domain-containing protein [Lachnospiraceae bacterium]
MRKAKEKMGNQGFSLVEVIVSMLILAIIVMPLLQNFLVAQQTNIRAKKAQYATALNTSIMEAVKEFGIEQVALQFYGAKTDFYLVGQDVLTGDYYQINESGNKISSGDTANACVVGDKFIDNKQKYFFQINGVKQGTGIYDVKISYDSTPYTGAGTSEVQQNNYQMPKVEALNANQYALIDPFSSFRTFIETDEGYVLTSRDDYDTRARRILYQLHDSYYTSKWADECKAIQEENARRQQQADEKGEVPVLLPFPERPLNKTQDDMNGKIARKITITINKISESSYEVSGGICYTGEAEAGYFWSEGTKKQEFQLYSEPLKFTTLKGIYLFYPLYKTISNATHSYRNLESLEIQVTGVELGTEEYLDVYVAMQEEEVPASYTPLNVILTGTSSGHIRLYSQENLYVGGIKKNSELVGNYEKESRIYDVQVDIYEAGTSNLVSSMTSSIRK